MRQLPEIFHLKQGETLLAVLTACEPVEMFWLGCEFTATDAFQQFEPLFRQSTEDLEQLEANYAQLRKQGVVLIDTENGLTIDNFILHIQGNTVELRYTDPRDLP